MNTPVAQKKIAKLQIQICLLNSFFYWRFICSYKNFIRVFMIVLALLIERAKLMFDCTMHASFFFAIIFLTSSLHLFGIISIHIDSESLRNQWWSMYLYRRTCHNKNKIWNLAYLFKFFIYIYRGDNFLVFIVSIPIGDITYSKRWFHQLKLIM